MVMIISTHCKECQEPSPVYTRGISSEYFPQLGLSLLIMKFLYIKHNFGMNLDAISLLFILLFFLYIFPTIPYGLAPLYLVLLSCGSPQFPFFSVIPADTFGHFSVVFLSAALLPPSLWPTYSSKFITHGKRCRIGAGSDPLPQNSSHWELPHSGN